MYRQRPEDEESCTLCAAGARPQLYDFQKELDKFRLGRTPTSNSKRLSSRRSAR